MTPDRFIAAAFIELADDGTDWNLYVAAYFIPRVEQRAAELARESVGDGERENRNALKESIDAKIQEEYRSCRCCGRTR